MNTTELTNTLTTLFAELVDGAPQAGAYMLNPGDPGLPASLDRLTAGENPFVDANWAASWERRTVSDAEWEQLRAGLRDEAHRWLGALGTPREVNQMELNGVVGSIAHLGYHVGAIRQIDRTARGPAANN